MKTELRNQAVALRLDKQRSFTAIRKELGVAKSTLSYWLKDFPLSHERIQELQRQGWEKGEASRERFRETMRKKREAEDAAVHTIYTRKFKKLPRVAFFTSGLMLYLAEGTKNKRGTLALANTDPRVIQFFLRWLDEFFRVSRKQVRAGPHLYEGMNRTDELIFWSKKLTVHPDQFYKPWVTPFRASSFSYRGSHRHGTCTIYLNDIGRYRNVMTGISTLLETYLE